MLSIMAFADALRALNALKAEGVIEDYAVARAMAIVFWAEQVLEVALHETMQRRLARTPRLVDPATDLHAQTQAGGERRRPKGRRPVTVRPPDDRVESAGEPAAGGPVTGNQGFKDLRRARISLEAGGLRTDLDGPRGGLVYVEWDDGLVCGVSVGSPPPRRILCPLPWQPRQKAPTCDAPLRHTEVHPADFQRVKGVQPCA
jgi:hypothetical protein